MQGSRSKQRKTQFRLKITRFTKFTVEIIDVNYCFIHQRLHNISWQISPRNKGSFTASYYFIQPICCNDVITASYIILVWSLNVNTYKRSCYSSKFHHLTYFKQSSITSFRRRLGKQHKIIYPIRQYFSKAIKFVKDEGTKKNTYD